MAAIEILRVFPSVTVEKPGAIDGEVICNGDHFEVTLIPQRDGVLDCWGQGRDCWISGPTSDLTGNVLVEIVDAVREAWEQKRATHR